MGLPLTDKFYSIDRKGTIRRLPEWQKVPAGKAEIKAEKRRNHRKRHYQIVKTLRKLQLQMTKTTSYYLENANV